MNKKTKLCRKESRHDDGPIDGWTDAGWFKKIWVCVCVCECQWMDGWNQFNGFVVFGPLMFLLVVVASSTICLPLRLIGGGGAGVVDNDDDDVPLPDILAAAGMNNS